MPFRSLLLAFVIAVATSWIAGVRGSEPPDAVKPVEGKQIDQLIRQLGSDAFEKRESATRDLERIGVPALAALRRTASMDKDAEVRRRAADLVERIENGLDQLLLDYRSFGLPLPPDKAPLVRVENWEIIGVWDKQIVAIDHPGEHIFGFLVEPATKHQSAMVVFATETFQFDAKDVEPVLDPKKLTAKDMETCYFRPSIALVFALQMHAQGWKIAETVFEKGFHGKTEHSPRTALRLLAWDYWDQQLLDVKVDYWPTACKQMKALLADERELDTPENRNLLKSLELALVPGKAKPGSVESLIDDLINVREIRDSGERFVRVLDLGFEAVPALLAHLDDDRLTRYRKPALSINLSYNEHAYHFRVRDVASDLLRSLAGDASREWPANRDDRVAEKRQASAWWDEARKQGEEAYLIAHVLPPVSKMDRNKVEWPDWTHLRLLGKKYPRRLGPLYRDVLANRPHIQSYPLADAVGASSLSREEKVELLTLAAGNKNLEHRFGAFFPLKKLDAERFVTLLVTTLDDLPRTPPVPYSNCREACFAHLVCETDDPRAWRALEKAARRADAGLRMEMLKHTDYPQPTATQRRRRLAFLAAFLDDDTVRDISTNKEMFDGTYAGAFIERLEVRNYAASRMAEIVGTPAYPTSEWTAEKWTKLREQMREIVKRELAKDAKK